MQKRLRKCFWMGIFFSQSYQFSHTHTHPLKSDQVTLIIFSPWFIHYFSVYFSINMKNYFLHINPNCSRLFSPLMPSGMTIKNREKVESHAYDMMYLHMFVINMQFGLFSQHACPLSSSNHTSDRPSNRLPTNLFIR